MSASPEPPAAAPRRGLGAALESAEPRRRPFADYRNFIKDHYDGLPDPRPGLRELHRVLAPGGRLLLLATEDTLTGAMCSRLWHCRTYNRGELRRVCENEVGLRWHRELWFSGLHKMLRLGGIIVELRKE